MIEIIIIVCIILIIWKWSVIKPYLTSPLSLSTTIQNSNLAHDNAIKNVQQLYNLQNTISHQLQVNSSSQNQSIYAQQLTIQATADAALAAQKLAEKLKMPIASNAIIPEIQYVIELMNNVKQLSNQAVAQANLDKKIMNDQIQSIQDMKNLLPNTKTVISDLDNQISISKKSITTVLDKVTGQANTILTTGTAIEDQSKKLIQILSSANAQGKILASKFNASVDILKQVYNTLNLSKQQAIVINTLISKTPNPVMPESLKSSIPADIINSVKQLADVSNDIIKAINELSLIINLTFSIDITNKIKVLNDVIRFSEKGDDFNQTSLFKATSMITFIDGLINPVQNAIITANKLQDNAAGSFQQVIMTANKLLSSSMGHDQFLDKIKTALSDFTNNLQKASNVQQKVVDDTNAIINLQQPLQNAISAHQSAPTSNLQNLSQDIIQKLLNQLQPLFKTVADDLQLANEAQKTAVFSLKTLSENKSAATGFFDDTNNNLTSLNNAIAKSKSDTQDAISQANAVQTFINIFVDKLKDGNKVLSDWIDFINSTQSTIDSVFPVIQSAEELADKTLINVSKIGSDISSALNLLISLINNKVSPITGVSIAYNYDVNSNANIKILVKNTNAVITTITAPYINLLPNNFANFLNIFNPPTSTSTSNITAQTAPAALVSSTVAPAALVSSTVAPAALVSSTVAPAALVSSSTQPAARLSFINRRYGFESKRKNNIIEMLDDSNIAEYNPGYYTDNYLFGLESSMNY